MIDDAKVKQGLDAIAKVDKDVAKVIDEYGYPEPRVRHKGFSALFSIVVSQQLSTHAAKAIMKRANELFDNNINAKAVNDVADDELRAIGLSRQKVNYVKGLGLAIENNQIDLDALEHFDDEQVAKAITDLKGFGPWSAEIYLMFSLQREDIFPAGDLALQLALQRLKGLDEKPTPKEARALLEHWSPYRTIGSLFLWHYYQGAPT